MARFVEHAEKLERYLAELPPEEAEVVECVDLAGLTVAEVAEELELPYDRVWRRLQRARAQLADRARASVEAEEVRLALRTPS
jgi:RNA polymerase sigma factor (sigma-70 family)